MRTIRHSTRFKKDYKREKKGQYRAVIEHDLPSVISMLATDAVLPPRLSDHALTGEWQGYRDCHIRPDLVLIYRKPDAESLELARLGSHSELAF